MKVSVIFLMFLFSTSDTSCAAATQTVWAGSHLGTAPTPTPSLREPLTLGFLSFPQLLSSGHATVSHTGTCTVLAEQGRELSPLYMEPKIFAFSEAVLSWAQLPPSGTSALFLSATLLLRRESG